MKEIIIAVDGPAGSGKGTLARNLAEIYNLDHLDTGLLYRAVALKVYEQGLDFGDEEAATIAARSLHEIDLTDPNLRKEIVSNGASQVAKYLEVRNILLEFQRTFASSPSTGHQGVVLDGRDIGSVVLPEAPCKIFLTASPEIRAERRCKELQEKGIDCIFEVVLEDIKARDTRDQERQVSPLRPAKDAYILDTSRLGIDDVVEKACIFVDSQYPDARIRHASSE